MASAPQTIAPSPERAGQQRYLPPLLGLFFGSGCAALIYEIVWFQLLQLVIGASAVSLGVLLGVFMGGMCLGSLALPRLARPDWRPLRVYACLEAALGVLGMITLFLVPWAGQFYASVAGPGGGGFLLRGALCGVCLLAPTALMGATLPAIAREVEATPEGVSWLGFFYGGNIAGAVAGSLLAGFYLLRVHDLRVATYTAAAINGTVALAAWWLSGSAPASARLTEPAPSVPSTNLGGKKPVSGATAVPPAEPANRRGTRGAPGQPGAPVDAGILVLIGLSGFCALGAEVAWTRLLSLLMGATVYAFSIILAVFLAGLGLGSGFGSFLARYGERPRAAVGLCQFVLCGAVAWGAWMLACSLPFWPINPTLARSPWFGFQLDLVRCAWAVLPAACLWGASFPLALAAASSGRGDPGRLVGGIYAANTLGGIVGALACSLVLAGNLGTQQIERLLIGVSAVAGCVAWWRAAANPRTRVTGWLAGVGAAALLVWSVPAVPWELIAYGRFLPTRGERGIRLFAGEGRNASVAVVELSSGVRNFHVSGKVEASSDKRDMRLQRMLGHLPALLHDQPRSILVVGCGAGVTAGSFVVHPEVQRIVICDIEPLIPQVVAQFFGEENHDVLRDPRTEVVYDDARHFLLTTKEKFDIITSDPIHPWVKGAATLYTKEYFELCRRHLNPGGIATQWVPLYESNLPVVKSEVATFFSVFPQGTIWSNDENGEGYDVVLLGPADAGVINLDRVQERLSRDAYRPVLDSLRGIGCRSGYALLASYAGYAPDLAPWLKGAELNLDRNLRLQYLAGLGLNFYEQDLIFTDLLVYRRFPEELFIGSAAQKDALRQMIQKGAPAKKNP